MSTITETTSTESRNRTTNRLRGEFIAMKLAFKWFGVHRTLSDDQKRRAAESFGAETKYLSAGKKLIDTSHPLFRTVNQVRGRACQYWKGRSLPYPDAGIRLVRNQDVDDINRHMLEFQIELQEAVYALNREFEQLKSSARLRLGSLYHEADYPDELMSLFDLSWEFIAVEPPNYLRQLSPEVYNQECERVQRRFEEAVELAEQAFTDELAKLVTHLAERLSGVDDGKPKIFRDSAVENMSEFFSRFRSLNIHSNKQLDDLVERATGIIQGVVPHDLRTNAPLRQQIATQLSGIQSVLDGMMVDRPRRRLLRNAEGPNRE